MRNIFKILFVIIALFIVSCIKYDNPYETQSTEIELIEKFSINVEEPSGLAIDAEKGVLYTVSDNTNNVYKITKQGKILQEYQINADDLEGICIFGSNLLLANERSKQLISYNILSQSSTVYSINYTNTSENSGFEGVTYNEKQKTIYVINEKQPGELLELDLNFVVKKITQLNFANDYSGIFYDSQNDYLWIVSDESSTINKCYTNGDLIKSYKINVTKCEGIAIDSETGYIYLVSDSDAEMYVYKIK